MTTSTYINYSVFPWETAVESKDWLLNLWECRDKLANTQLVFQYWPLDTALFSLLFWILLLHLKWPTSHVQQFNYLPHSKFLLLALRVMQTIGYFTLSIFFLGKQSQRSSWKNQKKITMFEEIICDYDYCPQNTATSCLFLWTVK